MILHALNQYFYRISETLGSRVPREGFERKEIPFVVVLDSKGGFRGLDDTREGEGRVKRARSFIVPRAVKRTSNSESTANLLWDNPAYVFGWPKSEAARLKAARKHQAFVDKIRKTLADFLEDEGVKAVLAFLAAGDFKQVFEHPLWPEIDKTGGNISFRLEGQTELICQRPAVTSSVTAAFRESGQRVQQCLVTGELDAPARVHTAIKGVSKARPTGANIVSFNLPAFWSYGKEQSLNAPVGKRAEFAYTTALNTLLSKDSRRKMRVGDATTAFWAEKPHILEDWFAGFFGVSGSGESFQDTEAVRALFAAPSTGARPLDEDYTRFHVLGLAPNESRIVIRFWYEGTVGEVASNIRQHFEDCSMVHDRTEADYIPLHVFLRSTAVQGKDENIQPNLAGDIMNSILSGTPYPTTLLSGVVRRIEAEQSKKDERGRLQRNVTYARASLIKAVLVRQCRYYRKAGKEVDMALDPENVNQGYLLGRLFAVLEKAQEEANPGINATIRDRFYGSASSTPVAAFPHLMKLKNHHLGKLANRGRAVNLERLIGEIMSGISNFPSHLSLGDQGRFAVGYYHQRQSLFAGKAEDTAKEE